MTKHELEISKKDMETMTRRMQDMKNSLNSTEDLVSGLISYCMANGYTEQDATTLVKEKIIPTVDEYNSSCVTVMGDEDNEWLTSKISERCEGLSMTQEYRYKAQVICAIRAMNRDTLERLGMLTNEDWEAEFLEICDHEYQLPEGAEATEKMLKNINAELVDAMDNSTAALRDSVAFNELLESSDQEGRLYHFAGELWQDARQKYCFATAACVAHHNHELESIPEDMDERCLTLHCCKGIDVAAIEAKVASGEMESSRAYELMLVVAKVAGALALGYAAIWLMINAAALSVLVSTALFGETVLGAAFGFVMLIGQIFLIGIGFDKLVESGEDIIETTFYSLEMASKAIVQIACEKVAPALVSSFERIKGLWQRAKAMVCQRIVRCRA